MLARTFIRRLPQPFACQVASASTMSTTTAANGVTLVCKETPSNLVSMKFAVLGGASAESEAEKGAAHMCSVAAFAGTKNKNGIRLMRELEDIGATVSASADREKITIDVTVMATMAELAFERVAETITSPPKNNHAILDYYSSAHLAYENHSKNPKHLLDELLHEAAFGEATPMGSSQFAEDLDHLTPEAVFSYRKHQFTSNNLVIAASGLSKNDLRQYTDKYLSELTASAAPTINTAFVGGDAKLKCNISGKTFVALAFPADKKKPFAVLRTLLHNKLNKAIESGSGSEVSCFHAPYAKSGLWGVYACGSSAAASNQMIEAAVKELKALSSSVPAAELETAKNQLTLQMTAALESEAVTCALLAAHLAGTTPAENANYANVSAAEVSAAAKASLAATPAYAVLGKTAGAMNYPTLMKLLA